MIGARQLVHPRLRYAAAQFRPILKSQALLRSASNLSTTAPRPTSTRWLWVRRFICFGFFSWLGAKIGFLGLKLQMRPPHDAESELDEAEMLSIRRRLDNFNVVKQLREDPDYVEAPVYGNYSSSERGQRLTSGPMAGSRGLGEQRIFTNNEEKTVTNVLWLGKGLEGFPLHVHGGALATVLDETLARVAIQHFPERTGVTANLDINYRKGTLSNRAYCIRATLDKERSTERKAYVKGELRDSQGNVLVEATGLFVVPRGYTLPTLGADY
ncbi:PaaI family thioesterase [Aspergillus undulatus]|uniref:PaaI family thioesterase n=1 Tax=Aspergillus undulatus TaxID=1810928 RepID=UPI003CCCE867